VLDAYVFVGSHKIFYQSIAEQDQKCSSCARAALQPGINGSRWWRAKAKTCHTLHHDSARWSQRRASAHPEGKLFMPTGSSSATTNSRSRAPAVRRVRGPDHHPPDEPAHLALGHV
jgi:hypothetical protein